MTMTTTLLLTQFSSTRPEIRRKRLYGLRKWCIIL